MRFYAVMVSLICLLGVAGCSDSTPRLPALSDDAVILAYGDSLTYGTGVNAEQSYPAVLQQLSGRTVINEGKPGETTDAGLERLPGILDKHKPDLVILCHGGNDMLRKLDPKQTMKNLHDMIVAIRSTGAAVVMLGVPRPKIFLMSSADFYITLANEMKVPIDTTIIPQIESDKSLKSDAIHPNANGYQQMAQAVLTLLVNAKAI